MLHCLVIRQVGSFSCTLRAGICLVVCRVTRYVLEYVRSICPVDWRVVSVLHAPHWGISYWPRDGINLVFLSVGSFCYVFFLHAPYWNLSRRSSGGDFLLHDQCWNLSFTPTPTPFPFVRLVVSPSRPVLKSVSSFGTWGASLKRPVLDFLLIRQLGSFSYTPRAGICLVVWRVGSLSLSLSCLLYTSPSPRD